MPELLRTEVAEGTRRLGAPEARLDAATTAVVERAVAEAEARAYRDGEAAGRAAAADAARRAATAVTEAVESLRAEAVAQREAATTATLELACQLAADVLDATPPDEATTVLTRVRSAVDALDDDALEVHLHPEDAAALADVPVESRLQLVVDPAVGRGEARVAGAWGGAELTRAGLLAAAHAARAEGRA